MKRREFIKKAGSGLVGVSIITAFPGFGDKLLASSLYPDVVKIENGEPEQLLKAALKEIGGMSRFINKGDVVVVKPNIGWDRRPELAANTNPDLIFHIVKACLDSGAKKVKVFDRTCNNSRRCYRNSKIKEMAEAAGADVSHMRENKYKTVKIPNGKAVKEWPIYAEYLNADKVIDVPVAKHHSLSKVSLGMKNLMGVMGSNRGSIHANFTQKMVDIASVILPTLTIVDGYRILTNNGPQGGDPADVKTTKTLIMSSCVVAADAESLKLFGHKVEDVHHVREAISRGLSKFDMNKLSVKTITL